MNPLAKKKFEARPQNRGAALLGVLRDRHTHLTPEAAREEYRRTLSKTEIKPPAIGEASDLAVPGPAGPMRLRKYVPANPGREAEAAILFMHGGGCVLGLTFRRRLSRRHDPLDAESRPL